MTIENGKVVSIHYTLKNDEGELLDSSAGSDPLAYLHGADNIVSGLEAALTGRAVGDTFDVRIAPADAYGERQGPSERVPREAFPPDAPLRVGMPLRAETQDGQQITLFIEVIEDDAITVSPNHPLAGVHLNFAIEVVGMRDATDEERTHGHVHGPGGHDH